MNKLSLILFFVLGSMLLMFRCTTKDSGLETSSKVFKKRALRPEKPAEAAAFELLTIKNPHLGYPTPEKLRGIKDSLERNVTTRQFSDFIWKYRGPYSVGGRTRAVLIDKRDTTGNTVFAAGVAGGLWKSSDFQSESPSWKYITIDGTSLPICTISQDPTDLDVMYFGTGEGYFNADSHRGSGLYRSTDGGDSWTLLPRTDNSLYNYTQKIIVDRFGHVYAATRDGGLRKSINQGERWKRILGDGKSSYSNRAVDIEIAGESTLYATMGLGSPDGIYRSHDFGNTWKSLVDSDTTALPRDSFERIEIAVSQSDSMRIYAVMQDEDNSCKGIYRSDDQGDTWVAFEAPGAIGMNNFARNQAWYDLMVEVDPNNSNVVYIGGVDLLQSVDSGETWQQISQWYGQSYPYVHADQHNFVFFPGDSYSGISTNDGGVFKFTIDKDKSKQSAYCTPLQYYYSRGRITSVKLHNLENRSSGPVDEKIIGYSDYTSMSAELSADSTYILDIEVAQTDVNHYTVAWIDWNVDGELDSTEIVYHVQGANHEPMEIKVPANCAHGVSRMRIRYQLDFEWTPSPCDYTQGLGETEDYTILLNNCKPGVPCSDGDICTENDSLTADCMCVGELIDVNQDGNCDIVAPPEFEACNDGYNITQFYALAIDPRKGNNYILGGTQDNGTYALSDNGSPTSKRVTGGDGAFCFIDEDEPDIQISSYVYNNYFFTSDAFENYDWESIGRGTGRFINPCDYDSKENTLYAAYSRGYISRYSNIGKGEIEKDTLLISELDSLLPSAFAIDPHMDDAVWVGTPKQRSSGSGNTNQSQIVLLSSAHEGIPKVEKVITFGEGTFFSYGYLRCIEPHSADSNRMLVTFSNYGIKNIWETLDGGATWTAKDGNLPDMPVHWTIYDPKDEQSVYIGTEMGVWKTNDITADDVQWDLFGDIPLTRVSMMKYRESDHTLVAATHGRGIYQIRLDKVSTDDEKQTPLLVYPNPATDYIEVKNIEKWMDGLLTIYNVQGRTVDISHVTGKHIRRDISHLTSGVYVINIEKDGRSISQKIVKE